MFRKLYSFFLLLLISNSLFAQQKNTPFWDDIKAFKKQDSISFPASKQILFVGSSSFTKWTDVQNYFPAHPIINRGFGGSSLPDVIRYADDIIFPYHLKQIVIYCGENDFAASDTVSVETVVTRFKELFYLIRNRCHKVPIGYISIKPSPNRQNLRPKFEAANNAIEDFLKKKKRASFIDVYHAMLKDDGTIKSDIFLEDNLHMNAKGYAIWQKLIEPALKK